MDQDDAWRVLRRRLGAAEGDPSAIDASADAQVYARFSTFKGTIHHNDTATFHDLGGNVGD